VTTSAPASAGTFTAGPFSDAPKIRVMKEAYDAFQPLLNQVTDLSAAAYSIYDLIPTSGSVITTMTAIDPVIQATTLNLRLTAKNTTRSATNNFT